MSFSPQQYDDHKIILAAEGHRLERRHAHARMLKERDFARPGRERRSNLRDWMLALLRRRPESSRPVASRIDAHDLTDYVCRLADGSMGRVAIILGTDEEWSAVCVRA